MRIKSIRKIITAGLTIISLFLVFTIFIDAATLKTVVVSDPISLLNEYELTVVSTSGEEVQVSGYLEDEELFTLSGSDYGIDKDIYMSYVPEVPYIDGGDSLDMTIWTENVLPTDTTNMLIVGLSFYVAGFTYNDGAEAVDRPELTSLNLSGGVISTLTYSKVYTFDSDYIENHPNYEYEYVIGYIYKCDVTFSEPVVEPVSATLNWSFFNSSYEGVGTGTLWQVDMSAGLSDFTWSYYEVADGSGSNVDLSGIESGIGDINNNLDDIESGVGDINNRLDDLISADEQKEQADQILGEVGAEMSEAADALKTPDVDIGGALANVNQNDIDYIVPFFSSDSKFYVFLTSLMIVGVSLGLVGYVLHGKR